MLMSSLNNGKTATGVFMDLKKAFDDVDHRLLVNVLNKYSIKGVANRVVESYLGDRTQQVKIGNQRSQTTKLTSSTRSGTSS